MCGIIGTTGPESGAIPDEKIRGALAALSHRGPDGSDFVRLRNCTLGQTRLAIIDLPGGSQPMIDAETGNAITFNGEIYNYKELRAELQKKGHTFVTNSDTEVILKAYAEYSEECPKYLDGMFAFAIWDKARDIVFLARDRFGKKPLYYAQDNAGTWYFASEIKALLALGIRGELDLSAIDNYLQLSYIPPWKSAFSNIKQLPPAYCGILKDGKLHVQRYWQLVFNQISISYEEAKEEARRLLREAVKKRMLAADVEVGALLSGGVDSTIVSLLASEFLNHPLKTFALGYGEYINELPYAKQASEAIGSKHFELTANSDLVVELESVIAYFDEPHADTSDFPQHLISKLAASEVKVALSGDGGDELFMGYGWYLRHQNLSYRAHTFEKLFLDPFRARVRATRIFSPIERMRLWGSTRPLNNDIFAEDVRVSGLDPIQKINAFDLTTYLPGQLLSKIDRTSMMHGLEVRSPFLDTALAEFVCNLPNTFKADGQEYKIILKDILAERMPNEFVYRRKQGFGAPVVKWLREPKMREFTQKTLGFSANIRSLLRGEAVDSLLNDFYSSQRDRAVMKLWVLLCLELWLCSSHSHE